MKKTTIGDHAVLLGASMAGLLTARVLTDAYAGAAPSVGAGCVACLRT
jgi:hypothetical protein